MSTRSDKCWNSSHVSVTADHFSLFALHHSLHRWDLEPAEARDLQRELAAQVVLQPLPEAFQVLGAADIAYLRSTNQLAAVMLTFRWPELSLIESSQVVIPVAFPYIPGLLSFREAPAVLEAYRRLRHPPEVLLCDGQGIAHPRKFGLASHLGLLLNLPTVGCAKKRLCGRHEPFELQRGAGTLLHLGDEAVGWVFCSRDGVRPVYISPGHLSDLETSKELVHRCLGRFRIPEPLRQAHNLATSIRIALSSPSLDRPQAPDQNQLRPS
jgi:deoxyribonuclease V